MNAKKAKHARREESKVVALSGSGKPPTDDEIIAKHPGDPKAQAGEVSRILAAIRHRYQALEADLIELRRLGIRYEGMHAGFAAQAKALAPAKE